MDKTHIKRLAARYAVQTVVAVAFVSAIVAGLNAMGLFGASITAPLIVSVVFALAVEAADILLWRWVASCHSDSLPTFFTAVSGFRMLLAVFTVVGCWAVVGHDAMAPFCVVFMVFYLVVLAHHSLFFARVSNSQGGNNTDGQPGNGKD